MSDGAEVRIIGIGGMPEVAPGDDLAALIGEGLVAAGERLQPGDIVVITHKIVSKAEGQVVDLRTITPSPLATEFGERWGKDPRKVEIVLREARRIVRMQNGLIIAETAHGFVCANAGVDASNASPDSVVLLPRDPDASATDLRAALKRRFGLGAEDECAVIVSDSFGRPWRNGIVNVAIGVSGMTPLVDYRGETDAAGYELSASVLAVADEVAAAAELVMHKLAGRPVAIVRGYRAPLAGDPGSGRDLIMAPERDMFR
ncbi:MAG TPA: coenzyme F420-0:L-glutamate ligase [Thermomicrobiales bacterium]|nr:coenzyme F420-0:L-glutamate ligase [Thermomicrobiales bacterium]